MKSILPLALTIVHRGERLEIQVRPVDRVHILGFGSNFVGQYARVVSLRIGRLVPFPANTHKSKYTLADFDAILRSVDLTVETAMDVILTLDFDWPEKSWLVRSPPEFRGWWVVADKSASVYMGAGKIMSGGPEDFGGEDFPSDPADRLSFRSSR